MRVWRSRKAGVIWEGSCIAGIAASLTANLLCLNRSTVIRPFRQATGKHQRVLVTEFKEVMEVDESCQRRGPPRGLHAP